jgi:hypothetical protein
MVMNIRNVSPWAFSALLLLALLLLLEAGVRWWGYAPGDVSPNWANFQQVDSLIVYEDFIVDTHGILVANSDRHVIYGKQVNSEGFHSPEFSDTDSTKRTVVLIGDSFTWGMSATHDDSSFAGLVRRESGWNVHNLGIPAADPVQYALVAERFIPRLRPDVVCLFFFMGNDVMLHDRVPDPFREFYYFTNAGALWVEWDGRTFSDPRSAYDYFITEKYFLSGERNALEWGVSKSAILSRLYSVRFRWEEKLQWERQLEDLSLTNSYLLRVRQVALDHGAQFRIIVIPERKEADMSRDRYEQRFGELFHHPILGQHVEWPEVAKDHFVHYPDAHLNDRGHAVYAEYLLRLLDAFPSERKDDLR